jgi:hypothetical protein
MRSRVLRTTGSFLGLLAILLMALAPVFSHTLSSMHEADGELGMHCSMPSMQSAAQHDRAGANGTLLHLDACGYCSLLAHMPAIVAFPVVFALVVQAVMHVAATRFKSARLVEPLRPGQARAPPVLFF